MFLELPYSGWHIPFWRVGPARGLENFIDPVLLLRSLGPLGRPARPRNDSTTSREVFLVQKILHFQNFVIAINHVSGINIIVMNWIIVVVSKQGDCCRW